MVYAFVSGLVYLCMVLDVGTAGENKKRLVGMLIPEKALPELLAELQSHPEAEPEPQQDDYTDQGMGSSSTGRRGILSQILAGIRRV